MISANDVFKCQSLFIYKDLQSPNDKVFPNSTYRILSFFSQSRFLLLITSAHFQDIYLCNVDSNSKKRLLTLPIHKKIISSSLSINEDKLFVVIYSPQNCFASKSFYTVHCYIINNNISYPVSVPIFGCIPKIECYDSNSRFIFSGNNDQFEIYDILCNEKEFQLHLDKKSKNGMIWWCLKDKNQIEYVKIDSKKEKYKFICHQKTFHLPILSAPLPSIFLYLKNDPNQNIILYLSSNTFGLILPFSQLQLKLAYKQKINNYSLTNFVTFKNDLFMCLTPQRSFIFVLLNSISQPRSAFEIKLDKNCEEQYLMQSSYLSSNCIHQLTGAQYSISFNYKPLISTDSRLFIPFFHYFLLDDKEKTFELNFKSKSIRIHHHCDFLSLLTNDIMETFWNGNVFQEYFLCIFLRDIFPFLPQKQKDFFIYRSTTFCPTFCFKSALEKFTQYQVHDADGSSSSQLFDLQQIQNQYKKKEINSWGILKIEDTNTFLEHVNIYSHNSNHDTDYYYTISIYDILVDLILSFNVEQIISEHLYYSSLIQIYSLLSSITDLSLNTISNLFQKNNREPSLLKKTNEIVFKSLSKTSVEFWEANKLIKSSFSVHETDPESNFGTKMLTKDEARSSWWKIHLSTQMKEPMTEQNSGNSIFAAIVDATAVAKEEVQRNIISFYRPYFSDKFV